MPDKILRLPEVIAMAGLKRSSIYAFIKKGTFPAPVQLGQKAVGWCESEIAAWIEKRVRLRPESASSTPTA